jgi:hypothetical protein
MFYGTLKVLSIVSSDEMFSAAPTIFLCDCSSPATKIRFSFDAPALLRFGLCMSRISWAIHDDCPLYFRVKLVKAFRR